MHVVTFLKFAGKVLLAYAVGMLLLGLIDKKTNAGLMDWVNDPASKLGL